MTIAPSGDRVVLMTTWDSGGENAVALSSSSASRWTRSEPARPAMDAAGGACTTTRWYCSTSDTAARRTSTTGTGAMLRLARSVPARTSRFSLLRRMRVARWSSWNRLDSWSASCSLLSSASMSCSWRSTRAWLRRERLMNMALTLACSAACSAASRTACPWTASNARATWPTSSRVPIGTGSTATSGVSPARMLSTACGSRRSATSSAELRSSRSDRISDRATSTAIAMPTSRPSMRMTELMPARLLARCAAAAAVADSSALISPAVRSVLSRAWS